MSRNILTTGMLIAAVMVGALLGRSCQPAGDSTDLGQATIEREILYWVAPMDPNYRRDAPGKSPSFCRHRGLLSAKEMCA